MYAESFDVNSLGSEALMKLYGEAASYEERIRIEIVSDARSHQTRVRNPASTVGIEAGRPTILFSDSLGPDERIEAIAHELGHLLLVYRYGLGIIWRRIPCSGEEVFRFFTSMSGDWGFFLGQIANTVHHLILTDYLREEYNIESQLHLRLLYNNFRIIADDREMDEEALRGKAMIALEHERLIGRPNMSLYPSHEVQPFWIAYEMAQEWFGKYSSQSIPTPSAYEENILSFLETQGYSRGGFIFYPSRAHECR